jgi:WS/DGAT/MGAT family acyltransferase
MNEVVMQRLTPLAAAFLENEDEDPTASLAIGSLAIFEGPAPSFEAFVSLIEQRLPLIPRYRHKLRTVRFDLAAPAWVDDPDFDIRWHIRNTALPAPGGPEEIGRLMSRVMTQRMDRSRPMWEYWFCEGLAGGRWALLSKLHHCMVDGVSGTDLYRLVLDASRNPTPQVVVDDTVREPAMSSLSFANRTIRDAALAPVVGLRALGDAIGSPGRLARRAGLTAKGLFAFAGALRPVTASSLNGPLDASRRYAWTSVAMADILSVRHRLGGTVNDVALAAVTGGFRQLLLSRGEQPTAHMLRSLVPVSTRDPGAESIPDNRVSLMLPFLPVDVPDARERLAAVQAAISSVRSSGEPVAGDSLTTAAAYGPFAPVSLGMRLGMHLSQHVVSTVTTNVPGPRTAFYALGRELEEILPYVPIANRVRIGVAMFSYCGALVFGITGDYPSVPDIQTLADGISSSMAELVEIAERSQVS